ncbi:inorganic phosphate transporter [Micromonospora zhanjiangensis]|uniref:Anion permease n=1 Tax=Micromonospora zhanjiangensis TaxID=1522057 RepID=A0ABV8KQY0_9ACTN
MAADLSWVGFALAALFAAFTGFNDAGALVGVGLRVGGLRPVTAVTMLCVAVATAPILVGTAVAATLGGRLVALDEGRATVAMIAGVGAAVLVTGTLAARGLPTSLTLALIGGIAGAGVGVRAPVDWATVAFVLLAAAVAPVVGALAALLLTRVVGALPAPEGAGRRLRRLHAGALGATCLAYGANDGQKMLAVYAAVHGATPAAAARSPLAVLVITGCFLLGGLLGLPRLAAALAGGLTAGRPDAVVVSELSGAGVVLGTAVLGAPVSMTQSLSGAMVGTGLSRRSRKVRWRGVIRLGRAWLLTLPAAFVAAALGSLLLVPGP